jgi:UDP-N-acetylmuramate dehydrogenase
MLVRQNVSLKPYNTFGIDVRASYLAAFDSTVKLRELLNDHTYQSIPKLILGGGSNILFTRNFEGLVLKNEIPGITVLNEDGNRVLVEAGAGVIWHALVTWSINHNLGGIENLSLIPGRTGAAPIQNIGAYGVELKDTFHSLKAVNLVSGDEMIFEKDQCEFGYRDSIFKRQMKGRLTITSVVLELAKNPVLQLKYGAIEQELKKMGISEPGVKDVSEAVCNIRRSKLPDPAQIGNAGSFFKNPEISPDTFEVLAKEFQGIVSYPVGNGNIKLAAGWMIEQCGWKGKVVGQTGSHKNQALVLVNYGEAKGEEILELAMAFRESVKTRFGIIIEPEVNVM